AMNAIWRTRSSIGRSIDLDDLDVLGAVPEATPTDLAQPVVPAVVGDDARKVVRRQLTALRRRRAAAVREEDLALADPARIDRKLARSGMRGVVLVIDAGPEF